MQPKPNTRIIALVGISGSGKSTLLKLLLESLLTKHLFRAPVSATTRPKRDYEHDGVHYHFRTHSEFQADVDGGKFLEHEVVHKSGHRYGVLREEVERILSEDLSPTVDVNIAGAFSLKEIYGDRAILIWVDGPQDEEEARERLRKRGMEEEEIVDRMLTAKEELQHRSRFDLFVDNSGPAPEVAMRQMLEIVLREIRPL